jgi:hypothetical protein
VTIPVVEEALAGRPVSAELHLAEPGSAVPVLRIMPPNSAAIRDWAASPSRGALALALGPARGHPRSIHRTASMRETPQLSTTFPPTTLPHLRTRPT